MQLAHEVCFIGEYNLRPIFREIYRDMSLKKTKIRLNPHTLRAKEWKYCLQISPGGYDE